MDLCASVIHSLWTELSSTGSSTPLSTADPQVPALCAQVPMSYPHRCPLFGNIPPPVTALSESRHTEVDVWAVEYWGKPGDTPVE
ncbi:hypothetical protein GCM10017778_51670 [Streptomyces vinaceus]|nr:hypothetical protein GCM10017778_51670 [Streptomyces vinaceus]